MSAKVKIIDLELTKPLSSITGLDDYGELWVLVRLHQIPLGYIALSLKENRVSARKLRELIIEKLKYQIVEHLVADAAFDQAKEHAQLGSFEDLFKGLEHPATKCTYLTNQFQPFVSLAICTRNRAESLERLLNSVTRLNYPNFEVLVIDNAPDNDSTASLMARRFPQYRYILEPVAGLDNARNRAITEARGEIIAYTDDDTVVDPNWLTALVPSFETPDVMCVTGLVIPYELEHKAQQLFEGYGGFTRGFKRATYHFISRYPDRVSMFGAGKYGTGANMAFRRSLFSKIGTFDPALDVGTVTNGGGDLDIYFRTLMEGHTLVYEPAALVWHVHRADLSRLSYQLQGWGTGHAAFLTAAAMRYPEHRLTAIKFGLYWFRKWPVARALYELRRPGSDFLPLAIQEVNGAVHGPFKYFQARRDDKERRQRLKEKPAFSPLEPELTTKR